MIKTTLSVILMLVGSSMAGITKDKDIRHNHDLNYMNNLKKTHASDHLYVHLIPHTHDDVGWLKNPD